MLALTKIFGDFRSNWKEAGTDLDQTISSYPDFLGSWNGSRTTTCRGSWNGSSR